MLDSLKKHAESAKSAAGSLTQKALERVEEGRSKFGSHQKLEEPSAREEGSPDSNNAEEKSLLAKARGGLTSMSNTVRTSVLNVVRPVDQDEGNGQSKVEEGTGGVLQEAKRKAQGLMGKKPQSGSATEAPSEEETSMLSNKPITCGLSYKQRLQASIACYVLSGLLNFAASFSLHSRHRKVWAFALLYFLGNVIAIASSALLVGPAQQLKVMFMPVRRVACIIWLSTMFVVLIVAWFIPPRLSFIILLLVFVQYVAMLWYGASYVPYGRTILKGCVTKAASRMQG